ncbi:unnamed protein product [Cylindrotheca closterium]|uniref:Transmembrane protein n=1 Tax=Cylindrotheca closterium TaxID=2856 RepID=A0AAD2FVZ9_9STRA|nr:unnamed protein product [Cylindrotheca closterium]
MRKAYQIVFVILYYVASVSPCTAFVTQPSRHINSGARRTQQQRQSPRPVTDDSLFSTIILKAADKEEDQVVEVGSKEYLEGFISSPIQDESVAERGSGLEQALKLGGFFTIGLAVLFLGFMASNGLL